MEMRATTPAAKTELRYQSGFGNSFASEAVKGALPVGQNSPQKPPKGFTTNGGRWQETKVHQRASSGGYKRPGSYKK